MVDDQLRVEDVRDLHAFTLAGQLRSLSAVGKAMGESTATVSRRISRLEAALGVTLLRRSSRGIAATEEGIAYRARVMHVLELLGAANAGVKETQPAGTLRVSVPPGMTDALAPVIAAFCELHPQVVLVVDVSARFVDLEAERFDVAVRATAKLGDSQLVAVRVPEPGTEGVLVCSPAYAKRHGTPRRVEELAAHRVIALGDEATSYRMPVMKRGGKKSMKLSLPVALATSDLGFVKAMALEGVGIASLPRLAVRRDLDEGRLLHVLPQYVWPTGGLFLVHRGGAFVAPKVRAFIDHVKRALAS